MPIEVTHMTDFVTFGFTDRIVTVINVIFTHRLPDMYLKIVGLF